MPGPRCHHHSVIPPRCEPAGSRQRATDGYRLLPANARWFCAVLCARARALYMPAAAYMARAFRFFTYMNACCTRFGSFFLVYARAPRTHGSFTAPLRTITAARSAISCHRRSRFAALARGSASPRQPRAPHALLRAVAQRLPFAARAAARLPRTCAVRGAFSARSCCAILYV